MNDKIKYSIVIPFYNEEKVVESLLKSILRLKTTEKYEVIMVDHDSTDKSREIIEKYQEKMTNLIYLNEPKNGIGVARKTGGRIAKGEIMICGDADIEVPVDYLERIGTILQSEKYVAVVGIYRFSDKSALFNLLFRSSMMFFDFINRMITGTFAFRGLVFAIKREVYLEAGEFNPNISALEDVELSLRVKKLGKIKYSPSLSVTTSYRRFRGRFLKQMIKRLKAYYYRAILRDNVAESEWEVVR